MRGEGKLRFYQHPGIMDTRLKHTRHLGLNELRIGRGVNPRTFCMCDLGTHRPES